MASYLPPKKNDPNGYITYASLVSQAAPKTFQANPTLAAGDVKVCIDDGAPANIATLPTVDADHTKRVKVVLSQAETNGDNITVTFQDAAGEEWCDLTLNIHTTKRTFDELDEDLADAVWDEDITGHETADTAGRILGTMMGEWEMVENQLKCYGVSGNLLFTFNLTRDDEATEFNPDKRTPV